MTNGKYKKNSSEKTQRLIEWILSGQEQQLVNQTGYVTTAR